MRTGLTRFALLAAAMLSTAAYGEVIGFVDNPTGNSVDFRNKIADLGGDVNEAVDFDSHPVGGILPDHYAGEGVRVLGAGSVTSVATGEGPGQGNTSSPPLSDGEGLHAASNYVAGPAQAGSLTISFDEPSLGAGVFLLDVFNPNGVHPITLDAYDGPEGGGNLLGSFNAAGFNFQRNKLYFMGVVSTDNNIRSIRVNITGGAGDALGFDNVLFAGSAGCQYTLKKNAKSKGGCDTCPVQGDTISSGEECENKKDCAKKYSTTISCPGGGPGICKKIKGKRASCG